jgi:hypothetical protein
MATIGTSSVGACHFWKLPLELREDIYRLLLTTPYCTRIDSSLSTLLTAIDGSGSYIHSTPSIKYDFHTALLTVNKQMKEEATEVLLRDNDFVILKVRGVCLRRRQIPAIRFLKEEKINNPVLKVEIGFVDGILANFNNYFTLITTPEGVLPIVSEIWSLVEYHHHLGSHFIPRRGDMKLYLNFNFKSTSQYEGLTNVILKPWGKVNCISELELSCNMKKSLVDQVKRSMLQGPTPSEVADYLKEHYAMAKEKYLRNEYDKARWLFDMEAKYYNYLLDLSLGGQKLVQPGNDFGAVFREALPLYFEGKLNLAKTLIRQSNFKQARDTAATMGLDQMCPMRWKTLEDYGYKEPRLMQAKFSLCVALTITALRGYSFGEDWLPLTVLGLPHSHRSLEGDEYRCAQWDCKILREEIKRALNTEILRLSPLGYRDYTRGKKHPVKPDHSFWEWLEVQDDAPLEVSDNTSEIEAEEGAEDEWEDKWEDVSEYESSYIPGVVAFRDERFDRFLRI